MKIIGSREELLLIKSNCLNGASCRFCVLREFCAKAVRENPDIDLTDRASEEDDRYSPVELFELEKFDTIFIEKGGCHETIEGNESEN